MNACVLTLRHVSQVIGVRNQIPNKSKSLDIKVITVREEDGGGVTVKI